MSALAPDLFARRFDGLVEIGRSRLPSLAPGWTDYNAHDPGITLMELLAWVAEAQLYSLARPRRDERLAYGAYFGIAPQGPQPSRGLIWPLLDPDAPVSTYQRSLVIPHTAAVLVVPGGTSVFHPTHDVLWVPGTVQSVQARLADGRILDCTTANARGQIAYEPFGPHAGPRDVLAVEYMCQGNTGLFPPRRVDALGAYLAVGVRAEAALGTVGTDSPDAVTQPVHVRLTDGTQSVSCPVVYDSTHAFLRSGICVIDVAAVQSSPTSFTLEFSLPGGGARAPLVRQIGLNVLPIVQQQLVSQIETGSGLPDRTIELDTAGLCYGAGAPSITIQVADNGHVSPWAVVTDLQACGPSDLVAQIDSDKAWVRFGNGLNGSVLPLGAQVEVTYPVCDGAAANTPRNQSWTVEGIVGTYGRNPDAVGGGAAASVDADRRRRARQRSRACHPLVSAADIEAAALALPDLDLGRAQVVSVGSAHAQRDLTTLIAMRRRAGGVEPAAAPETDRWLAAIAARLAPRLLLGRRLRVIAPTYVDFTVTASVQTVAGLDPRAVSQAARKVLAQRLQLTDPSGGTAYRKFGLGVSPSDVSAWLRGVAGVARVLDVQLKSSAGVGTVSVPARGLPRLDLAQSKITPVRDGTAAA
jgi:predicted phage baseplate assembly protein